MYHHGGGYADIKRQTGSWLPGVDRLRCSSRLIATGYPEIRGGTVWLHNNRVHGRVYLIDRAVPTLVAKGATHWMRLVRPLMIGNGAYVFKPGSSFARRWLFAVEKRLDQVVGDLRANPAGDPRDRQGSASGYPIPWTYLLADIFHPLNTIYLPYIGRDLPPPSFSDYM
jgi:hypothetical protein